MKSRLLLGCTALVVACGSNSGTSFDGVRPTLSPGTAQTPQQPPSNGGATVTCAQLAAAVVAKGCVVSSEDVAACEQETAANSPCAAQWQSYLACFLANFTCGDNGDARVGDACAGPEQLLGACVDTGQPLPQPGGVCQSPSCNNCTDSCTLCECEAVQVNIDCTTYCALTN